MARNRFDLLSIMILLAPLVFVLAMCFGRSEAHGQKCPDESVCHIDTLDGGSYIVGYSRALRIPITTDWTLRASDMGDSKREPSWRFAEDKRVATPRARHADYTNSGYDRGHMVPAADRSKTSASMKSTFVMTNVCPQSPRLNRGEWKKTEEACRSYARGGHPIMIHVDAVFWRADTSWIGLAPVAVPHGFMKTVRCCSDSSIIYSRYFQND